MNDTRSMTRARRFSARIAVVLCLLLAVGVLPMAAFAAPLTVSDVEASYLNSATINLTATGSIDETYYKMDDGAEVEGTSATTSIYGAHVLKFWSEDTTGLVEAEVSAPFFVDDTVLPEVAYEVSDVESEAVEVELTATDNFNGSGVDFLCYRVDGGKIMTAMAPARLAATKAMLAKLADVKVSAAVSGPPINQGTLPPASHYGEYCAGCHEIIIPTPDPTTTPDPTGTPVPTGVHADVDVEGVGTHTIEYWAQDVARNATDHVTKTIEIAPAAVVPMATTTTFEASAKYIKSGRYVKLVARLHPATASTFANTYVRFELMRSGAGHYSLLKNVKVHASGYASYTYKVTAKGKRYHRVKFLGNAAFAPAPLMHGLAMYVR